MGRRAKVKSNREPASESAAEAICEPASGEAPKPTPGSPNSHTDLPAFAAANLAIRSKDGAVVPLAFNAVQRTVHDRLERQLSDTGRVRALILKARQPGISTYVEARFYWKVIRRHGVRAYILTHLRDATDAIFEMVDRFHARNTDPAKPHVGASNAKELWFDRLDSGYRVGTAGSKAVGRGHTIQFFHGSEVAHWPNAGQHMAGVMQAVPDGRDTEIILESTANGPGGLFFDLCKAAERGEGDFILIFVPWFTHEEYRETPPKSWSPPPLIAEYGRLHDLSRAQLYWAWRKNAGLVGACGAPGDDICWLFRQEYPATAEEAFHGSAHDGLIRAELVVAAIGYNAPDQSHAPLILGVDIARGGGDMTRIIDRQGRRVGYHINRTIDSPDLMEVAGMVAAEIERLNPHMTFIDGTGIGAGVYDRLRERGFKKITLVNFGAKPTDGRRYANKRAEMWGRMAEWLADPGGADLVRDDALHVELCAPGCSFDSNSRMILEPKEKLRERLGFSPDGGDALALTFAEVVRSEKPAMPLKDTADFHYRIFGG